MNRRELIQSAGAALAYLAFGPRISHAASSVEACVEKAHAEIWRRFVDKHGVILDYTGLNGEVITPTPEECKLCKPNALGWWSPIEDGAMFNGLYMDAAVNRWRVTKKPEDAAKAKRLADGLMFLASLSEVKGFVARGAATDDKTHYPMGSDDQTLPWFIGLWRYLDAGLASNEERARIIAKLSETAEVIVSRKWQMPAETPFRVRGSFAGFLFYNAPRLLVVAKMMHQLTGNAKWEKMYLEALHERGGKENLSRLELCERGLVFEHGGRHCWTASCCVAAIRALWEMEKDKTIKAAYAKGLDASSCVAMEDLALAQKFDNEDLKPFDVDWRKMNTEWKPHTTAAEAEAIAHAEMKVMHKFSPRRAQELRFIREPAFAAWIVTLTPNCEALKQRAPEVEKVLSHYRYERLYYSQFFPVESAWWRLKQCKD